MKAIFLIAIAISSIVAPSESFAQEVAKKKNPEVVLTSDIKWKPLNPKRGKNGPQAGTLWGDQTKPGASGFLVKFVDGFSSPPHIHNITYRGIVISGGLYNGPANVEPMWMSPGSYWTQPVGQPHITAARGVSVAYVEIHEGPYLVLPTEQASDNGERPINVDASNLVWLDASNSSWIQHTADTPTDDGAKIAFLWGKPNRDQLSGSLIKVPAGFTGALHSHGSKFRAVVIEGQVNYQTQTSTTAKAKTLAPGSYFGGEGAAVYQISSSTSGESTIYVHTDSNYELVSE